MHEFGADRAGVGGLQAGQQVAQFHARLAGHVAGAEFAVQILVGQVMEGQAEIRRIHRRAQAQRIQVGAQVAARTVGGDQAADIALALVAAGRGRHMAIVRRLARGRGNLLDDHRVGHVTGLAALETVEVGLPFGTHTVRVNQVLLVQVFDVGGIASVELRGLRKLLQEIVHDGDEVLAVGMVLEGRGRRIRCGPARAEDNPKIIPARRERGIKVLD